ncbi:MAG TPA: 50S ribosomal protein L25 [Dehalococcoidia bacterium]|nr:50S ribosomal protein L25 [Dehalococcoidia bacterium]
MDTIEMETTRREVLGKEVRFLRRQGVTPVNLFGHGLESISLQCDTAKLTQTLSKAGQTRLINLKIGSEKKRHSVVIRGVQREPLRGGLLHVDFLEVSMTERVKMDVPLVITGEAPIFKSKDYMMTQELNTLAVECLPADIPENLELDISSLAEPEQVLRVKDIKVGEDVTVHDDAETVVIRIMHLQAAKIEEAEVEGEVTEAAEAGEGGSADE